MMCPRVLEKHLDREWNEAERFRANVKPYRRVAGPLRLAMGRGSTRVVSPGLLVREFVVVLFQS